jgi:hypothetical protein
MEGYGGPAQPSPTIAQCLNGGLAWLEVKCNRCKTRVSLPLKAMRRPRHADLEAGSLREVQSATLHRADDQADARAGDYAFQVGASGRGALRPHRAGQLSRSGRRFLFQEAECNVDLHQFAFDPLTFFCARTSF